MIDYSEFSLKLINGSMERWWHVLSVVIETVHEVTMVGVVRIVTLWKVEYILFDGIRVVVSGCCIVP